MNEQPIPTNTEFRKEWTAGRVASIVLLAILCGALVWNAYSPEDIFFSDLKYELLVGEKFEPQKDVSVQGRTLQIGQSYYPKGMGVHANSELNLRFVPESYSYFAAEIGIDAEVPADSPAAVVFSVFSDGTQLYESPIMKPGMPPRLVYVPIRGRRTLTLKAIAADDGAKEGAHADWAMARFIAR
ncbi:MAG: NPCBM/NEW2 domain-containing protein [Candidatus Omnitrophota bacterium]